MANWTQKIKKYGWERSFNGGVAQKLSTLYQWLEKKKGTRRDAGDKEWYQGKVSGKMALPHLP